MTEDSNAKSKKPQQDPRKFITADAMKKIKGTNQLDDLSQFDKIAVMPSLVTWNFSPGLTKISFAVWQALPDRDEGYSCVYSYGGQGHSPKLAHCVEILGTLRLNIHDHIFSLSGISSATKKFKHELHSIEEEFTCLGIFGVEKYNPHQQIPWMQKTIEFIGQCCFCTERAHSMITALENVERHMDKTTGFFVDDLSTDNACLHNPLYECTELAARTLAEEYNMLRPDPDSNFQY